MIKLSPFSRKPIYDHPETKIFDLVQAIQVANKSYLQWRESALTERLDWLNKIQAQFNSRKKEIIFSEAQDQGLSLAFTGKANFDVCSLILNRLRSELELQIQKPDSSTLHTSVGVVAVILSWNLSNRLFVERALAAVLAGNTVLVKVSSLAVGTSRIWQQILHEIHFPVGIIQFIVSSEDDVKGLLVTHPGIKALSVTGHLETCATILKKQAAFSLKQFKKLHLSSGSKNSAVVLGEPTPLLVQDIMESFLIGQGQLHWNSARLFVLEKFQKEWTAAIQEIFLKLKPAEAVEDESMWGPLVDDRGPFQYDKLVLQARDDQAKIISAKEPENRNASESFRTPPVFVYDMSNCSELQQDELSLPLYVLSAVKYAFDIPKFSNVSYYGSSAQLWGPPEKLTKIIQNLEVGRISLNRWSIFLADPFSVVKQSGFGLQDHRIFGDFNSNVKILA